MSRLVLCVCLCSKQSVGETGSPLLAIILPRSFGLALALPFAVCFAFPFPFGSVASLAWSEAFGRAAAFGRVACAFFSD